MIRTAALVLTVITGFSGLVYEVTWQKCLATLLGSHSEAAAAVLGIYLGGLSLGYAVFGSVVRRRLRRAAARGGAARLLLLYGAVEAGIGVWALAFPLLFGGVQALSLALAIEAPLLAFAVDVALTALLIGPPTVLMGGTIPILTQALAHDIDDATRFHAFVYGFNTAGAFAGALAAAFVLIPALGLRGTLLAMGGVNIAAGASFVLLGGRPAAAEPVPGSEPATPVPQGFGLFAAAALLLGFAMMSVQTALIRIGALALGASHFTFASVVAVFVLCLALGSLVVSALPRIPRGAAAVCPALLAGLLALLYLLLPDAGYAAHVLRTFFSSVPQAFHTWMAVVFLCVLVVLAVPVGLSGASLPLLFHELRREMGELGSLAGRLYSWNTLGNLLGALLGGYALLFWLDLHHVYRLAIGATALAAALLATRAQRRVRAGVGVFALALCAALVAVPAWPGTRMAAGAFRIRIPVKGSYEGPASFYEARGHKELAFYDDDPVATVSVHDHKLGSGEDRAIRTNGKSDGSLDADYTTMALVSLLPCVLTERCENAFVIGWGTGVSVGELAALVGMQRVDVAEISYGVMKAAPLFDHGNLGASQRPNVNVIRSDAYRALLRSDTRYDVIVSEPSNPWTSGVEMLYSREFLGAARDRLRPGGVYAQWFHLYETDTESLELVMRTYSDVFEHVAVWYALGYDLLLLGFDAEPRLDLEHMARRAARADIASGLRRAGISGLPALLIHELLPLGVVREADLGDTLHTLFHPVLADRAARAFFVGGEGALPYTATAAARERAAQTSLWQTWVASTETGPDAEDLAAAADEVCRLRPHECATFLAWWSTRGGGSEFDAVRQRWARSPRHSHLVSERSLHLLGLLLGDVGDAETNPELVRHAAGVYRDYYFHAVPFRRESLDKLLANCRSPGCDEARKEVEEMLPR